MKNRIFRLLFVLVITVLLFPSCGNKKSVTGTDSITVSILPFSYFAGQIAGDKTDINVIVPPGASPATYEPPPSVISGLRNSDAIIFDGYLGFEMAWMDKLLQVNPAIPALYLEKNQELIAAEAHRHGDHMHLSGVDPHFWMSPASARIIAGDITLFLQQVYPDRAEEFERNMDTLLKVIDEVDNYCHTLLDPLKGSSFLIFHPALTYFARDYGLQQVPIEYEGKEPTAAWMKSVVDLARSREMKTILVQEEFNRKSAETIASEIGGRVVVISPLSENWPEAVREVAEAIARGTEPEI